MDYKKFDRFYTKEKTAQRYIKYLYKILPKLNYSKIQFLEPSAGSGNFLSAIQKTSRFFPGKIFKKTISCDIDPHSIADVHCDYLKSTPQTLGVKKREQTIVVGNPPFGRRSRLAVEFINKSTEYSDTIAFIVPLQFRKWSVQNRIKNDLKLIFDKELPPTSFIHDGKETAIRTCFQIWTQRKTSEKNLRLIRRPPVSHSDFKMFLHNNTKETLKYFDKKNYKWNFAVPRQGYYDYSLRVTNPADLKENIQWMFFQAENPEILKRIDLIDFEKLSFMNTTIPGYGKADVVQEYIHLYGS